MHPPRPAHLLSCLPAVAALAGACGEATGSSPGRVTVGNYYFSPTSVQPDQNGVVTWTWSSGGELHNVTFEDLAPGSGDRGSGSFSRDFTGTTAGTVVRFQCTRHAGMQGQVAMP